MPFHLKNVHWVPMPIDGTCPSNFAVAVGNKCFTSAAAEDRKKTRREDIAKEIDELEKDAMRIGLDGSPPPAYPFVAGEMAFKTVTRVERYKELAEQYLLLVAEDNESA